MRAGRKPLLLASVTWHCHAEGLAERGTLQYILRYLFVRDSIRWSTEARTKKNLHSSTLTAYASPSMIAQNKSPKKCTMKLGFFGGVLVPVSIINVGFCRRDAGILVVVAPKKHDRATISPLIRNATQAAHQGIQP